MKNLLLAVSLCLAIGTIITIDSCKKTSSSEDDSVSATDAITVMGTMNLTGDDAGSAAGQAVSFTGKTEGTYQSSCVSAIDSSVAGKLTITYNGTNSCFGLTRSGTVTVTLANGTTQWQAVGAQLTVTYNALKVTDANGHTFTLNGTHTITNVTGGLAWQIGYGLVTNDSAIHRNQSSNMSITFPNGSQRTWTTIDRTRKTVSVYSGGVNTITLTDYSQNTGGVAASGTNRFGNTFTSTIATPIVSNNYNLSCIYEPYQGVVQHAVGNRTATITYGTNSSGGAQGTPTVCGSGFYIQYENSNGQAATPIFVLY
jgi:hypothetical protein